MSEHPEAATMSHGLLDQIQEAIGDSDIALRPDEASLRLLARSIRQIADTATDPLLVAGVLLEGTVHLVRNVVAEQRKEAVVAVIQLLADRLTALDMH